MTLVSLDLFPQNNEIFKRNGATSVSRVLSGLRLQTVLSLIYCLPCDKPLTTYPSEKDEQPHAPIYLVFQLIRFTPFAYH